MSPVHSSGVQPEPWRKAREVAGPAEQTRRCAKTPKTQEESVLILATLLCVTLLTEWWTVPRSAGKNWSSERWSHVPKLTTGRTTGTPQDRLRPPALESHWMLWSRPSLLTEGEGLDSGPGASGRGRPTWGPRLPTTPAGASARPDQSYRLSCISSPREDSAPAPPSPPAVDTSAFPSPVS